MSRRIALASIVFVAALATLPAQSQVDQRLWQPVDDHVYLQEFPQKIDTDNPVTAVAVHDEKLFAVMSDELHILRNGELQPIPQAPKDIRVFEKHNDSLWIAAADGVYRYTNNAWGEVSDLEIVDFCLHLGDLHGATRDDIYQFDGEDFVNIKPATGWLSTNTTNLMEDGTQLLPDPVRIGPIRGIDSYSGTIYILRNDEIALIDRDTFVDHPVDWGAYPSNTLRDMLAHGSRIFIITNRGMSVLRGMALTTLTGEDRLPYEDTTCLAKGFAGDVWIGTTTGAIRMVDGEYHYFGPGMWLPSNNVHDIAAGPNVVYIATDGGLGIIRYEPYTLQKKADYFERQVDKWGHKRLGFLHKLYRSGDEWRREVSDNDGGHTAHYLAAMSFKYAVTRDPEAREEAVNAFKAMVWLDAITPKDGFIARAIWSETGDKGERSTRGSGGLPADWYPTDDDLWYWKGDTSSDEVNAHYYSVSLFHDLVAKGDEKERAKQHIANMSNHIMENGWVLRDMDGEPTRWGRWDPEYLLRPYGYEARGLNGMEAQTYMITAMGLIEDDAKYERGLQQLLDWNYDDYTVRQRSIFPPENVVPWDDELAFRCYHPLLKYTDDPGLRSVYLRSIERTWEVLRMQKLPFYNFIYGASTGNDCEAEPAVNHLREWPMDTVNHTFTNSHRHDLAPEPGYTPYSKGTRAISPRETTAKWGHQTTIEYDGGNGGRTITPPVGWLEDYWMGRYYGFIREPEVKDSNLVAVAPDEVPEYGAKPYDGAPRPDGLLKLD